MSSTATATPCQRGKPVKAPAAYCSTSCKRRAQNARAAAHRRSRIGVLSSSPAPSEHPGVLTPFPDRPNAPAMRPQWQLGVQLGGAPDPRKYVAKLYPEGADPGDYSNQRAFACRLTDHRLPARVGWYGLILGKAANGWVYETGPHRTVDEAMARVELWLTVPIQKRALGNPQGHFLSTICSASALAASVARGM
jgi:hypothetical protein